MKLRHFGRLSLVLIVLAGPAAPLTAEQAVPATQARKVRVTGVVRDDSNNITLPGIPVEVTGGDTVYTDVDGRYIVDLVPGAYEIKVSMDGYETKTLKVDVAAGARVIDANVGMSMSRFAETVTVTAPVFMDAVTSSAEAQLMERKSAAVITDNLGSQDMKNADSDAAAAMSRVTGLSVVDNQYVFVRGLGERYSNTTLSGSTLPTTEPDKKVVPLDLFPAGLLDSVTGQQVVLAGSLGPEFAGGLVQIQPLKFPSRAVLDFSYGLSTYTNATGKAIPLSPIGQPRLARIRRRRARDAVRDADEQGGATRHLHAGRRLQREPGRHVRSPRSATSGVPPPPMAPPGRTGARCSATGSASWASSPASHTPTRNSLPRRTARFTALVTAPTTWKP